MISTHFFLEILHSWSTFCSMLARSINQSMNGSVNQSISQSVRQSLYVRICDYTLYYSYDVCKAIVHSLFWRKFTWIYIWPVYCSLYDEGKRNRQQEAIPNGVFSGRVWLTHRPSRGVWSPQPMWHMVILARTEVARGLWSPELKWHVVIGSPNLKWHVVFGPTRALWPPNLKQLMFNNSSNLFPW
jgi:hypothetical protein